MGRDQGAIRFLKERRRGSEAVEWFYLLFLPALNRNVVTGAVAAILQLWGRHREHFRYVVLTLLNVDSFLSPNALLCKKNNILLKRFLRRGFAAKCPLRYTHPAMWKFHSVPCFSQERQKKGFLFPKLLKGRIWWLDTRQKPQVGCS